MRVHSLCAAAFVLLAASAAQATSYQVVDLGANLHGNDLNNKGQVVGSMADPSTSIGGFEWSPGRGLRWFKGQPADLTFFAAALNDVDQVLLVRSYTDPDLPGETLHSTMVRNPDGSRRRVLNTGGSNTSGSIGASLNNAGDVTGTGYWLQGNRDDFFDYAFFAQPGQRTASLTKGDVNVGVKVNNIGQALWYGEAYDPNGGMFFVASTPYLHIAPNTDVDMNLPIVDQAGWGGQRLATGLNDAGVVCGTLSAEVGSVAFPAGGDYAFLWSQAAGVQIIGDQGTEAQGINNNGVVIGGSQGKPALWTATGGWQNLFSLLSPADQQKLAAMTWNSLVDINDSGEILANVQIDGALHAVLLVPTN